MSEDNNTPTELELLKARADQLGVSYKTNITLETLRKKVDAELNDDGDGDTKTDTTKDVVMTDGMKRKQLKQEALKMVRLRITCMNPNKRDWPGEMFTVSNSVVGTVKKFIPFDNEDGWHVPNIIYKQLRDRQCQIFVKKKSKNGVPMVEAKLIREFAIDVLEPLTQEELDELAQRQAMSGSID